MNLSNPKTHDKMKTERDIYPEPDADTRAKLAIAADRASLRAGLNAERFQEAYAILNDHAIFVEGLAMTGEPTDVLEQAKYLRMVAELLGAEMRAEQNREKAADQAHDFLTELDRETIESDDRKAQVLKAADDAHIREVNAKYRAEQAQAKQPPPAQA